MLGGYESIYNNKPTFGLAKAMKSVPATRKYKSANDRLNKKMLNRVAEGI